MEVLVYDCAVDDSQTFAKFQEMTNIERLELMMEHVGHSLKCDTWTWSELPWMHYLDSLHKTVASPLLMHWRFHSFAQSHWYIASISVFLNVRCCLMRGKISVIHKDCEEILCICQDVLSKMGYCELLPNDILKYWGECTLVLPVDAHENTTTISSELFEILSIRNRILTIFSQAMRPIKRTWRRGWCRSYSVVIRRRREPVTASSGIIWSQWPRRTWHDRSWYSRYPKPMWGI